MAMMSPSLEQVPARLQVPVQAQAQALVQALTLRRN